MALAHKGKVMNDPEPTDEPQPTDAPKEEDTEQAKPPLCSWEPSLTREEIDRRIAEPGGMPLYAFRKMMGWD
jgi:hypothetical protein